MWAILNATYSVELPGECLDEGVVTLFIGPQHAQTSRELELLVTVYQDRSESVVFHAMELGPKFRHYREENSNGS